MDTIKLNTLSPQPGSKKNRKRVGRGIGSGFGKTSGVGHKGQKSRSGYSLKVQNPILRRLPKFGFKSRKVTVQLTIDSLAVFEDGDEVSVSTLCTKKLIKISKPFDKIKIISTGELNKSLHIKLSDKLKLSVATKNKILSIGGTVVEG